MSYQLTWETEEKTFKIYNLFFHTIDDLHGELIHECKDLFKNLVEMAYYQITEGDKSADSFDDFSEWFYDEANLLVNERASELCHHERDVLLCEYGFDRAYEEFLDQGFEAPTKNLSASLCYVIMDQIVVQDKDVANLIRNIANTAIEEPELANFQFSFDDEDESDSDD